MYTMDWSPHVSCFFPTYQRTGSVHWTPFSHWITAFLSLLLPSSPPSVTILPLSDSHSFASSPPSSFQSQRPSLHSELSLFISFVPSHINISQPLLLPIKSDPSVCCRLSSSKSLHHLSHPLSLLWVNMTHASIILLSFCHYYAL